MGKVGATHNIVNRQVIRRKSLSRKHRCNRQDNCRQPPELGRVTIIIHSYTFLKNYSFTDAIEMPRLVLTGPRPTSRVECGRDDTRREYRLTSSPPLPRLPLESSLYPIFTKRQINPAAQRIWVKKAFPEEIRPYPRLIVLEQPVSFSPSCSTGRKRSSNNPN